MQTPHHRLATMPEHQLNAACVLLDIEGTTSSIAFVHDVMFPFARKHAREYLEHHFDDDAVQDSLRLLGADLGHGLDASWLVGSREQQIELAAAGMFKLMDGDVKATGLKKLQGLIWKDGFTRGEMVAHLYDDVAAAIKTWKDAGVDVRIYSSGSIAAQKLFFGHSVAGDLLHLISEHYDTTSGGKKESGSYLTIANDAGFAASQMLFVSDIPDELSAATDAGMQVMLSIRPGNAEVADRSAWPWIDSFSQLSIAPV